MQKELDVFKYVKQVDAFDVAQFYLGEPNKSKKWFCPFHTETNPSFSTKNTYLRCFGCGWSGDIIDFVANFNNISLFEAVQIICKNFSLPLPNNYFKSDVKEKVQEAKRKKDFYYALEKWRKAALIGVITIHRNAAKAVCNGEHFKIPSITYLEVKTEYYINILTHGSIKEQLELYNSGELKGLEIWT